MAKPVRPLGCAGRGADDLRAAPGRHRMAAANGLLHESAHDALSDVRATIALAKLIKQKQPKLFDFCFALHKKDRVADEIGMHLAPASRAPFLHVSGMFPTEHGCIALAWPLATHPTNKNEIIVWDCRYDPSELHMLDPDTIRTRMFSRSADLPDGVTRLPIKSVHLNKSPMLVSNLKTLSPAMAERWGIDVETALANASHAASLPDMSASWAAVFQRPAGEGAVDVDEDLYGGFVSNDDRRLLDTLRRKKPAELATARPSFADERLQELLFRYRARNFPQTLSEAESLRWEQHRAARLFDGDGGARTIEMLFTEIDVLSESVDERGEEILGELYDYAEMVAPLRD